MKKNKLAYAMSLIFAFLFFSCNVLDQEPKAQLDIDNSDPITNETSARAALTGLYDALQDNDYYGVYFIINVDMFSDDVENTAFKDSYKQLNSQYVPTNNEGIKLVWAQIYRTINAANNIIQKTPLITDAAFTQKHKDEIVGAAEMIRGMAYLDLLRTYGEHWNLNSTYGVPVRISTATTSEFTPRSTVSQTYQRIIQDLQDAESKLPYTGDPAYASKSAATALLARTYLYMKDYANAAAHATTVINSGHYELINDYTDIYSKHNSRESIFELNFNFQDPSGYFNQYSQTDEASITRDLSDFFDKSDIRQDLIQPDSVSNPNLLTTWKYIDQSDPAFVIRIAEMHSIRAEALALGQNDPTQGLADLNLLRARAGVTPLQPSDVPTMSAFVNALLQETRKEFYAEGHRFFDLARFQKFNEVYGIENFRSIFPIPYIEIITANNLGVKLAQNPGF